MWARLDDGLVAETVQLDPAGRFHPSLEWVECPASTRVGDSYTPAAGRALASFAHPPGPTVADRLAIALQALAAERYGRECAGVHFQPGGAAAAVLIGTDRDAQAKLSSAYVMAAAGHWQDGTPWKTADGGFVPLSAADMQAVALKAAGYVAACYAREAQLAAAVAADLAADISAGWPPNA